MRQVSITNLYKNLSAELSDLPFEITKDGKAIATVEKSLETGRKSLDIIKEFPPPKMRKPTKDPEWVYAQSNATFKPMLKGGK